MPKITSPGPAIVKLKSLVGFADHDVSSLKQRAPQWSMGSKSQTTLENKSPGPAAYNPASLTRFGKVSSPSATMLPRRKELKPDENPGPSHNPTDPSLYRWRYDPKFSIGLRTKPLSMDQGPGPGVPATPLDIYKTRAPQYPMFQRHKDPTKGCGPGPNAYNAAESKTKVMLQNPVYSLRWRTSDAARDKTPSAADYDLRSYNPFEKYPAYSMRQKLSDYAHVPIVPLDNC